MELPKEVDTWLKEMALAGYDVVLEVSKIFPEGAWKHEVTIREGHQKRVKMNWGEDGIYLARSPAWKDASGNYPVRAFDKFDEAADHIAEELRK